MDEVTSSLALIGGVLAVMVPAVSAVINIARLFRANGDHLILKVGDKRFVIDVSSIDKTDVKVIDSATRAIQDHQKSEG